MLGASHTNQRGCIGNIGRLEEHVFANHAILHCETSVKMARMSETFALLQDHQKESIATILTVNSRTPDSESLGKDCAATWGLHKPVKNLGKLYQNQVRLNLVSTKDCSTIFPEHFRGR